MAAFLDPAVVERFNSLPFADNKVLAEYVWVDDKGELRSKTHTLAADKDKTFDLLPKWRDNMNDDKTGKVLKYMIPDVTAKYVSTTKQRIDLQNKRFTKIW